ncbi:MAG: sulfurtransferase TusA family protein [Desulfotignum sp.]|nr:sulfurtransferase TusA family protein [Desulfotignum sp.]
MQKIDLRGFMVPFTLLKISNSFRTLEKKEILEILLSDRDALDDLVRIIPENAYALIKMEVLDGEDQGIRIQLKKCAENRKESFP